MKASDLFVKCLEEEGVEYIFGFPGEETNDLMMSLLDSKQMRCILVRHEQAAAFMDAVTMFKPITKWSWSIRNANSIPEIIRRAFKISLDEKAGAVHLVLPRDK